MIRDLGFMIPDILHVVIPLWSLWWQDYHVLPGVSSKDSNIKRDLTCMLGMILVGLGMCAIL